MSDTPLTGFGAAVVADPPRSGGVARSGGRAWPRAMAPLALAACDAVAAQVGLLAAFGIGRMLLPAAEGGGTTLWNPAFALVAAAAVITLNAGLGVYETVGLGRIERFRLRVCGALWLPGLLLAAAAVMQSASLAVGLELLGATAVFLLASLLAEGLLRPALIASGAWGADVVVIGPPEAADRIARDLAATPEVGFRPVRRIADLAALEASATAAGQAEVAVIALSPALRSLDMSRLPFRRIVLAPDVGGVPALGGRFRALGAGPGLDFTTPRPDGLARAAKRALDLAIAVPALLLALPVILGTALAIRLLSPGPAFFVQRRVGWRGRPVAILKLRSMYRDADRRLTELLERDPAARQEWDTYMKLSRDPRVLPVIGNFIRRTSIDELPQLWNVVRGDISLVGPRPFPDYHVAKFGEEFQGLRCSVRPGLTGLWQVTDRSNADLRQQEALDSFYIRNWSLWLDLYIVLQTLPAVLSARGAR